MIGTKLDHYEITNHLGTGGMGEVYQATDAKLGRSVAIKLLPEAFTYDEDRAARFEREARVLASLNHPNIATIHGVEESGGRKFLVMELVTGETLAEKIKRGPIPLNESLGIATQITEALEAAHEKGVIHRDLKPANIKVTPEGKVKVLDFGLAKAYDANPSNVSLSNSPTMISMAATNAGMILGTAAYMSPEQAKGKEVDRRTDIFAFGAVLFEMLTGRPAFGGEDVSDILSHVLRSDPNWTLLPANIPPAIQKLLKLCLQKDARKRRQAAGDIRIDMEQALVEPLAASPEFPQRRSIAPWAVASVLAAALGVALWAPWRSEKPPDRPLVRLNVDLGADVALPPAATTRNSIAISPDGTRLAYVSGTPQKLFIRRLDQQNAVELPGTDGATWPFFSPEGQWLGFYARGRLNKISVEGGAVVPLAEIATFLGASWGESGNIIVADAPKGLVRVPSGGGPPEMVAAPVQGERALVHPQILPGGKVLLFTSVADTGNPDKSSIEVMTLADRHRKVVVRGGNSPHYSATSAGAGHLVYFNKSTLFAVPFGLDKLEPRGTAVPILDDVAHGVNSGIPHLDFSLTGTLVYRRSGQNEGLLTVVWLDSAGKTQPLLAKPGVYGRPSLSPDGQRLALQVTDGSGTDLWVYDWQRETMTRLTFNGNAQGPVWSPDGLYIVFHVDGQGMSAIRSDGAGQPQVLTQSKNVQYQWSFTPDGKRLAFMESDSKYQYDLWTVPLESGSAGLQAGKSEVFLQTPAAEMDPCFSPDGKWLAYSSNESGTFQIYVRAFPDKGGKSMISNNGGGYPLWSRTGHELLFESLDNHIMAASYSVKGDSFVADKPRLWSEKPITGIVNNVKNVDLAPDGKRIVALISAGEDKGAQEAQNHVTFLLNFFDELRRRAPLGK
jgi:serine/threonine-protein kinase